ncbi:MAG: putative transport system ATP-binding protein [Actinomycetota bacterium]|nr:putative transport system ATP-binding protein [Actinomycetota bacterium]
MAVPAAPEGLGGGETKTEEPSHAASTSGAPNAGVSAVSIAAHDLFMIYKRGSTETVALRGASLEVRQGEFVSLMGPSGSGKSSLLSILAGLTTPSAGSVTVEGEDLGGLDEAGRARWRSERLGLVFQRGNLIPFLTAAENVTLVARRTVGRTQARERAKELLDRLGLAGRADHRPGRLSGGEAQRAGIAVALANQPRLLLGDEVTGELDSETSDQVMALLGEFRRERGLTMLLVTHNPAIAARADRRLAVSRGIVRPQ